MKLRCIFFLIALPCLTFGQGYKINIKVLGLEDTVAYLGYHFGNQKYVQDTAQVLDHSATFQGKNPLVKGVYFYYSANCFLEFIVDEQNFSITTSSPNFIASSKVSGSSINSDFMELQAYNLEKQDMAKQMQEELSSLAGDEKLERELQLKKLNEEAIFFQNSVVERNADNYLGKFLKGLQKPQVPDSIGNGNEERELARFSFYKKHYFDNFDLSDEELLRSPVYHSVITEYLDKLTLQHPDSLILSVDKIISVAQKNEATFRYCLVTLSNKFETSNIMGFDKVFVHLVEKYYLSGKASWADQDLLDRLENRINQIKPGLIGNPAPSLSLLDPEMNPLDLEHIQAKYIVLYFYDHDCSHCKQKTPVLMSQYSSLKEKDVEVIAVDISTDVKKWKEYIESNNLTFLNGADPYVRSNFRYEYDIRTTPTVYILDENKTIVAKRIEVDNIPQFIDYLSRNN